MSKSLRGFDEEWTIQRLVKRVLRQDCECDLLPFKCTRCELLDDAERYFPTEFAKAASWIAKAKKPNRKQP
jgi:hypothetical protein